MKLPRILTIAALALAAASAGTSASAQVSYYAGPQEFGFQYTYYINGQLVSTHYQGCDGWGSWDGYNGYPDLTMGDSYDYIEWEC